MLAVQPLVDAIHELTEVIPRLFDAHSSRLHRYLRGSKVAAVLSAAADDDSADAACGQDFGIHVLVLIVREHFVQIRLNDLRFAQMIGGRQCRASHGFLEQTVDCVELRNVRHNVRFAVAVGHMNEGMRPQIQQRRFVLRDLRFAAERHQTGRHHRHGIAHPILLQPLHHKGVLRIHLHPVAALVDSVRYLLGEALQTHLQVFILQKIFLRFHALLAHIVPDAFAIELQYGFAADHDVGDAHQMHRKRDDIAVLHEIAEDVAVLEILVENTPHPILQVNAIIVFQILGLRLLVRAHQPEIVRQGEGHIHAFDDPAENGI
nr:MAG TPA: hypothetical protein [Caudoviricetes sp.]